jgi:hypothetical protein
MAVLALVVAPGVHHTAAGTAAAQRALLLHADLGAPWTAGATPKKVGALSCDVPTEQAGVAEIGAAVSPTYRESAAGPFLSQSVFVYDSSAAASRFYQDFARPSALDCLSRSVTSGGGAAQGVVFTVSKRQALPAPKLGVTAAVYRVVGRAVVKEQRVAIYVDVVLLQRGSNISQLNFSSFSASVAAADELRIARAAASRL